MDLNEEDTPLALLAQKSQHTEQAREQSTGCEEIVMMDLRDVEEAENNDTAPTPVVGIQTTPPPGAEDERPSLPQPEPSAAVLHVPPAESTSTRLVPTRPSVGSASSLGMERPPPYEPRASPPSYGGAPEGQKARKNWKKVWSWRTVAVGIVTVDLLLNLCLFFMTSSALVNSRLNIVAVVVPVIYVVMAALGRIAFVRETEGGMLLYVIIYFMRWTCDLLGMGILAALGMTAPFDVPAGTTALSAPMVGARSFYAMLFPCPRWDDALDKCVGRDGVGLAVALPVFGAMLFPHLVFGFILAHYIGVVRHNTCHEDSDDEDNAIDLESRCPASHYSYPSLPRHSIVRSTLISFDDPVLPSPPQAAQTSQHRESRRSLRYGGSRVTFSDEVVTWTPCGGEAGGGGVDARRRASAPVLVGPSRSRSDRAARRATIAATVDAVQREENGADDDDDDRPLGLMLPPGSARASTLQEG
ncbi:hypothetical protein HK104_004927 [Borealophlyctis nickersoniae]|nr:hypothetical protein HK104_004927 [Borealophlyctis nickersoniae]